MPLAIELAAARIRFLTPAAIHERLEGRLDLPGAGAADVPERQRSLRGAIMWSHELLDAPDCRLFERLGVFMGGFDLPRAEAVAGPAADLGEDVLDGLASLVDQSLVRSDEVLGEPRFSMLEPIREYALERLEAAGNTDVVRERHARAYLALAEELAPALNGDGQRAALDRLELEHANLRAAIDWADTRSNAEVALGIAIAVWRMWQKRGYLREARIRVGALIACEWFPDAPPELRAKTHEVMGGIIYWHGEVYGARPDYEAALAIWREVGDRREIANACYNLSFVYTMGAIPELPPDAGEQAAALLDEALSTYRSLGDVLGEANVFWGIGTQHFFARDDARAAEAFESALALYRTLGDRTQEAWSLHMLGTARLRLGEIDLARGQLAAGLQMFMSAGDVAGVTLGLDDLAAVAVGDGDFVRAARLSGPRQARPGLVGHRPRGRRGERVRAGDQAGYGRRHVTRGPGTLPGRGRGAADQRRRALRPWRDRVRGPQHPAGAGVTASLPEGVVTFLFTDIEGSTRLLTDIGDAAYGEALGAHRAIVSGAAAAQGGVPFGSEGDAVFVAFPTAAGAVRSAIAAQQALAAHSWDGGDVRVRMGIHTGEVLVVAGDYVGIEVHRAARVAAAAHGGQVILTNATRVVAGEIGAGIALLDLGEHRLKDFARAERLYQVEADGPGDFVSRRSRRSISRPTTCRPS